MATIFSHALLGLGAADAAIPRSCSHRRLLWAATLLPVVPDVDGLFMRWIPYGAPWGHRGATHSLLFALGLALLGAWLVRPREGVLGGRGWTLVLFLWLVTASHGLLDACTDGGEGIALLAPFDATRYFAPIRPIPVSPIGLAFFSARGWSVLAWETGLLWPFALALSASKRLPGARGRWLAASLCACGVAVWIWRIVRH